MLGNLDEVVMFLMEVWLGVGWFRGLWFVVCVAGTE